MALITTHVISTAGTAPTLDAAAADDTAETGNAFFLVVENTDASSRTVTIAGQGTLGSGDAYPDKQYTVAATNGEVWIPLIKDYANADGHAEISYSATTGVTRAVVRTP